MGVPGLYQWLFRKEVHKGARPVNEKTMPRTRNVYVDMNGIIHPSCRNNGEQALPSEEEMFKRVMENLDAVVKISSPKELLFLSIDGVAPGAKIKQQRGRRLRSRLDEEECETDEAVLRAELENFGQPIPPTHIYQKEGWDRNVITPGTPFMQRLSNFLMATIEERFQASKNGWNGFDVVLSDSTVPGEGEHKILEFIRAQARQAEETQGDDDAKVQGDEAAGEAAAATREKKYRKKGDYDFDHVIVGEDADLVMLGLGLNLPKVGVLKNLNAHAKRFSYFAPNRFRGHYNEKERASFSLLDIDTTRQLFQAYLQGIVRDLQRHKKIPASMTLSKESLANASNDLVLLFFVAGNDFLPHLPTTDIRDESVDLLVRCYAEQVLSKDECLVDPKTFRLNIPQLTAMLRQGVGVLESPGVSVRNEKALEVIHDTKVDKENVQLSFLNLDPKLKACYQYEKEDKCKNGNTCRAFHDYNVPQAMTIHCLMNYVTAFALTHSEPFLKHYNGADKDIPLMTGKLAPFGDGSFNFADGTQAGEVVVDPNSGAPVLRLSGLNLTESEWCKNISAGHNLRVRNLTRVQSGSSKPVDEKELTGKNKWKMRREMNRTKTSLEIHLPNFYLKKAAGHEKSRLTKLGAWAAKNRMILNQRYSEFINHALQMKWDRETVDARQEEKVSLGRTGGKKIEPWLYYFEKFHTDPRTPQGQMAVEAMSKEYIRGMQWNIRYYLEGHPSWEWMYPYHYAPFMHDILRVLGDIKVEDFDEWPETQPTQPMAQLLAVLPTSSAHAVPNQLGKLMVDESSGIAQLYPEPSTIELDPNGRTYKFEWVTLAPIVPIQQITNALKSADLEPFTPEEQLRNTVGANKLFSSRPELFKLGTAAQKQPTALTFREHRIRGVVSNPKALVSGNRQRGQIFDIDFLASPQHMQTRSLSFNTRQRGLVSTLQHRRLATKALGLLRKVG